MPVYAGYETLSELPSGALTVVWKAKRRRQTDVGEFVVKVCRPADWVEDFDVESGALASFIDALDDLKRLSETGAKNWVPVLASGAESDETYWVTHFYPRSLERLLGGRIELSSLDLQWLVSGVVSGLVELEETLKRPHANLKASNIFIDGEGRVAGSPIHLSDLRGRRELDLPEDHLADYRSLGRLIVQVVRRRSSDGQSIGWPLDDDGEWRRLGARADGWRELCNSLLDPRLDPQKLPWLEVAERVRRLLPPKRSRLLLATSVGLPLLILGAGYGWLRFTPFDSLPRGWQDWAERVGNLPPDTLTVPPEWALLCRAYNDWLGAFLESTGNLSKSYGWSRDPHLKKEVVDVLVESLDRNGSLNPRQLAGVTGDLNLLADQPPEKIKKGTIARRVVESYRAVEKASRGFVNWPERQKLTRLVDRFNAAGWSGPEAELSRLAEEGATGVLDLKLFNEIYAVAAIAGRAEMALAKFDQTAEKFQSADPVLRAVPGLFRGRLEEATDTKALLVQLAEAEAEANRLADLAGLPRASSSHDRERFLTESFVANFNGTVDQAVIARWEEAWADFAYLGPADDPRQGVDWNNLRQNLDGELGKLTAESASVSGTEAEAANTLIRQIQESRDQLEGKLLVLRSERPIRKDARLVENQVNSLRDDLNLLIEKTKATLVQIRPDANEWMNRVSSLSIGRAGGAVAAEWSRRRDTLLNGVNAASLARQDGVFKTLRGQMTTLQTFFDGVAAMESGDQFQDLSTVDIGQPFIPALVTWSELRQQRVLQAIIDGIDWSNNLPSETLANFSTSIGFRSALQNYESDLRDAEAGGREATVLIQRMDEGYGWEDPVSTIAPQWRQRRIVTELSQAQGWSDLIQSLEQLSSLSSSSDRSSLVVAVESPRLSVAITAWRLLGRQLEWPAPADLPVESRITSSLSDRTSSLRDADRRQRLLDEIQSESRRRWKVALAQAVDDESIAAVLGQRTVFSVKDTDLDAASLFNIELQKWKSTNWRGMRDDEIVPRRADAVGRLLARAQGIPNAPRAWLDEVAGIPVVDEEEGQSDVTLFGPGGRGWRGELSADGRRVAFRKMASEGELFLGFELVESDDAVPYFLGTSEVPLSVLVDIMRDQQFGPEIRELMSSVATADDDPRLGAQVWRPDRRRGLILNDRWTGTPLPSWPKPLFPTDLSVPPSPQSGQPIQYIPPLVARRIAEALGSRLPTPDEWKLAVAVFQPTIQSANVRDETWQQEQQYLMDAGVTLDSPLEGDLFWPRSAGTLPRNRDALAVAPQSNDGHLWFAEVDGQNGVEHLFGNVAEYLSDSTGENFFVAGGSALAPPELDPAVPYNVETIFAAGGYSDVGVRLAFDAPGGLAGRNRLQLLFRNQSFLR